MVQFIDDHRDAYGVESICTVVPIAPSTILLAQGPPRRSHATERTGPPRRRVAPGDSARLGPTTSRSMARARSGGNCAREGHRVARCTVGRLMRAMGLRGAVRGRAWVTTTQADRGADRPVDLVDRHFVATRPNQLWVSDFTYVATWRGFVYVAFVIDVFALTHCRLARVDFAPQADFVLDALEQAIYDRRGDGAGDLVHHSDRGTFFSTCRCATPSGWPIASIALSVGSRGDAYDNALAETIIGLFRKDGGDSTTRPVASHRRGRIRHARVGRLVQHPAVTGTDRLHPAGGVRRALL